MLNTKLLFEDSPSGQTPIVKKTTNKILIDDSMSSNYDSTNTSIDQNQSRQSLKTRPKNAQKYTTPKPNLNAIPNRLKQTTFIADSPELPDMSLNEDLVVEQSIEEVKPSRMVSASNRSFDNKAPDSNESESEETDESEQETDDDDDDEQASNPKEASNDDSDIIYEDDSKVSNQKSSRESSTSDREENTSDEEQSSSVDSIKNIKTKNNKVLDSDDEDVVQKKTVKGKHVSSSSSLSYRASSDFNVNGQALVRKKKLIVERDDNDEEEDEENKSNTSVVSTKSSVIG